MARPRHKKARRSKLSHFARISPTLRPIQGQPLTSPSRPWWHDERKRFVAAFTVVAVSLLAFYYFPRTGEDTVERWTAAYLGLYARVASWLIGVFDPHVSAHGNRVVGQFSMQIVKSCDAMESNILFTAAVVAVSAPWRRKAAALVVGLCALVAFNLVRLLALYWVGALAPSAFEFLHLDVWPLLMVIFAAVDFIVCMRWMRGRAAAGLVSPDEHVPG
jgi:exosortase H (IPTLxxWG-CTERM-specific)